MNHFTNRPGYDGIRSQPEWKFLAGRPPADHPQGAYFTTLGPGEKKLAQRLRIPREKVAYYFSFAGEDGLRRLPGGRGEYVFYSRDDFLVSSGRQTRH